MILKTVLNRQDETLTHESYKVFTDDGTEVSHAEMVTRLSRYGNGYLPTLAVGGVATELLYRRKGCVRMMFDKLFDEAPGVVGR